MVLVVLGVRLLLVVAAAVTPEVVGVESGVDAAYVVSSQLGDVTVFVLLVALVAACHSRPVTPHAGQLARTALVLAGVGVVLVLVLAVLGYASFPSPLRRIELASRLLGLVLPAAAVVALGLLVAGPRRDQPALAGGPGRSELGEEVGPQAPTATAPAPPDPQLEPTWQPDVAAGAAWWSAGEAASGRPAAGWGAPDSTGWQPGAEQPASPLEAPPPRTAAPWAAEAPEAGGSTSAGGPAPTGETDPPHPWSAPRS